MKSLDFHPRPESLSADPAKFAFTARMIVGPPDPPGEESFDVWVCTPEWLAVECQRQGGILDARHHVVVDFRSFDQRSLRQWLEARVERAEGPTWTEVAGHLTRLGHWEFEEYKT